MSTQQKPRIRDFFNKRAAKDAVFGAPQTRAPVSAGALSFSSPAVVVPKLAEVTPRIEANPSKSPAASPADSPERTVLDAGREAAVAAPPLAPVLFNRRSELLDEPIVNSSQGTSARYSLDAQAVHTQTRPDSAEEARGVQGELDSIMEQHHAQKDFIEVADSVGCKLSGMLRRRKGQCTDQVLALMVQGSRLTCSALAQTICQTLATLRRVESSIEIPTLATIADRIPSVADRKKYGAGDSEHTSLWVWEVKDLKLFEKPFDRALKQCVLAARQQRKAAAPRLKLLTKMLKNLGQPKYFESSKNVEAFRKDCSRRAELTPNLSCAGENITGTLPSQSPPLKTAKERVQRQEQAGQECLPMEQQRAETQLKQNELVTQANLEQLCSQQLAAERKAANETAIEAGKNQRKLAKAREAEVKLAESMKVKAQIEADKARLKLHKELMKQAEKKRKQTEKEEQVHLYG